MGEENNEEQIPPKLKPVIIEGAPDEFHRPNHLKQMLVLDAMQTTTDPEKIKEMIGARNVAEVHRVFDTMANQKEFQQSLKKKGLTFDYAAGKIFDIIETASKNSDKLKGLQMFLQAQGVDKFVTDPTGTANWQDLLIKTMERNGEVIEGELASNEEEIDIPELEMYEVKRPELPASVKQQDALEGAHGQAAIDVVDEALKKIYE